MWTKLNRKQGMGQGIHASEENRFANDEQIGDLNTWMRKILRRLCCEDISQCAWLELLSCALVFC